MRRLALVLSIMVLAVTAAFTLSGAPAFAAGSAGTAGTAAQSAQASSSSEVGALVLDCKDLSPAAKRYAKAHDICQPNSPGPADKRCGNCGCSYLDLFNRQRGYAGMLYGFKSTKGSVIHRNLHVGWINLTQSSSGGWNDNHYMASSKYSADRHVDTHRGEVAGDLSGSVTLWWGAHCTLLNPVSHVKDSY